MNFEKFFVAFAVSCAMCLSVYGQQTIDDSLETADRRLNHAYTALRAGLSETQQVALRDAQRAWITYRDAAATAGRTSASSPPDEQVLKELTTEQVDLLRFLDTPKFVAVTGSAETDLTVADNSLNLVYGKLRERGALSEGMKQAQLAWTAYRDAFAAAYASVHGEPGDQERLKAAAAKLTEIRTARLQELLLPAATSAATDGSILTGQSDNAMPQRPAQPKQIQLAFTSGDTTFTKETFPEEDKHVAQAQEQASQDVIEVKAEGIGVDVEGARKNAFSRAVESAVGLVVDAETLIENDELVRDQVLTYSDAIVIGYEQLSNETRADGLFAVRISAKVQRKKLIERLEANNISVKKADTTGVYASIVTSRKNAADAEALLLKTLGDLNYPIAFLRAELANEMPEVLETSGGNTDTSVTRWNIRVSYDRNSYFEVLVPKLKETLEQIASERPKEKPVEFYQGLPGSKGKSIREFDRSAGFLKLLTRMNETMTNGNIAYYGVSDAIFEELGQFKRALRPDERIVRISWLDASGNIVAQKDVQPFIDDNRPVNFPVRLTPFFENDIFIAPLFEWAMGYNGGGYVSSFVWKIDQMFTDAELASIQRVQVEIIE